MSDKKTTPTNFSGSTKPPNASVHLNHRGLKTFVCNNNVSARVDLFSGDFPIIFLFTHVLSLFPLSDGQWVRAWKGKKGWVS